MTTEEVDLEELFPDMRPIESPPSLGTINSIGVSMYGQRDVDGETGTYVKTHCFCVLFIPIVALGAYRVADASEGWYFLGKVPLSRFASLWNRCLLGCIVIAAVSFGWSGYTGSPEYLAKKKVTRADQAFEDGNIAESVRLYKEVAAGRTRQRAVALGRLEAVWTSIIERESLTDAAAAMPFLVPLTRDRRWGIEPEVLIKQTTSLLNQHVSSQPQSVYETFQLLLELDPENEELLAQREPLLKQVVAADASLMEPASELAKIYESREEWELCESLLAPHADQLGSEEGARVLGQIYARQGKFDEGYPLLSAYTKKRLESLHKAESDYDQTVEQVWSKEIESLREGEGPDSFYRSLDAASDEQQQVLVQEYVQPLVVKHPAVLEAQERVIQEAQVVPVALDLGIVLLRRAQELSDPEARRQELEKAEGTFLAIQGVAGETDQYRLFLGQVYYWLGKHDEGKKLFDELIESNGHGYEILLAVSQILREVGAVQRARELAVEAYEATDDQAQKYGAATMRALLFVDIDDQIVWLERSDPKDPSNQASLESARGSRAYREGDLKSAEEHYRTALKTYSTLPENAATLNNTALTYLSLFGVTLETEDFHAAIEKMEKAVTLMPSNSILLHNASTSILEAAVIDLLGDQIDRKVLKMRANFDWTGYLYQDQAGRDEMGQRVSQHAGIQQAINYLEKVALLSPKRASAYTSLAALYSYTRDQQALQRIADRVEQVDLDMADTIAQTTEYLLGTNDEKYVSPLKTSIAQREEIVKATRGQPDGTTFAVAVGSLLESKLQASSLGIEVDSDRLVKLAEESYQQCPSSSSQSMLIGCLLHRASEQLAKQLPEYAAMRKKSNRSLNATYLIPIALGRDEEMGKAVLAHDDVRKARELVTQWCEAIDLSCTPWAWAMLRDGQDEVMSKIVNVVSTDEVSRIQSKINQKISPLSATNAFDDYWKSLMRGDKAQALESLKQCQDRGVVLPFELP